MSATVVLLPRHDATALEIQARRRAAVDWYLEQDRIARARQVLNRVKDGHDVRQGAIDWALRITGDLE